MHTGLEAHLSSRQVARVVYGSIIGLALVVAVQDHPPTAGVMAGWLIASGIAVALAELYSEVIGVETSERHRVTRAQLVHMATGCAAVAFGVGFPAVFFLLAMLDAIELDSAFRLAKWGGIGLVGFYGYWAARFAGAPVARSLLQAALVAAVGGAVVAVKALLH